MNPELKNSSSDQSVKLLVIQLARLGDTIQSLMALRAAKQLYPQLEITFVVRRRYAEAARRVSWISNVVELPTEDIVGPAIQGGRENESFQELAKWIQPMVEVPWDFLVNWTYSEASSYLTGLLPALVKIGYTRRRDTSFSCADSWSHYMQAIVQGRVSQNIHLTDILTTQLLTVLQIHLGEARDCGHEPVTSKDFFELSIKESQEDAIRGFHSRKWIGIQLGAGSKDKVWDTRNWVQLVLRILKAHPEFHIAVLGGADDQVRVWHFLEEIRKVDEAYSSRMLSFVGKTDFDLWASIVARCSWIIAGDTAVIHLASVLGTRVFNLSIGPVKLEETGPYGNGHYVMVPYGEGTTLKASAVFAAWQYAERDWSYQTGDSVELEKSFAEAGCSDLASQVQVYKAKVRPLADGGGVAYVPVFHRPMRVGDWLGIVMGQIARSWYCGWVAPVGKDLDRSLIHPELLRTLRDLDEGSRVLHRIFVQAASTAALLSEKSGRLKSENIMSVADREKIQKLAKRLSRYDRLIERTGRLHDGFRAFSQMFKVMMHNIDGVSIADLGRESAQSYRSIADGIRLFREWLEHTMSLAKPMAIHVDHSSSSSGKKVRRVDIEAEEPPL